MKSMKYKLLITHFLLVLGICGWTSARDGIPEFPFLYSEGHASKEVKPDFASIKISISAEDPSSEKAEKKFEEQVLRARGLLKKLGIADVTDNGVSKH